MLHSRLQHLFKSRGNPSWLVPLSSKLTLALLGLIAVLAGPNSSRGQNINSSVAPNINGSANSVDIKNNSGGDWYFYSNPSPSAATMSRISGLEEFPWPSSAGNFAPDPDKEQNRIFPGEFLRVYPNTLGVGNTIQIPFSYSPSGTQYNFNVVVEAGAQVTSLNIVDGNPTSLATVHWQVTFDVPVSGVTAANFAFNNPANISGLTITSVTPNGSQPAQTWTVTASTGTGNGILGLNWKGHQSENPSVPNSFTGQYYDFSFYPIISQYPASAGVDVGTTTTMSVVASLRGPGSLHYQWYSGTSVTPDSATAISGATSSSYTPPVFNTVGSFQYFCRVTSTPGTYTDTTTAIITVVVPPQIISQPQNTIVSAGQPATFSVVATGTSLSYQWYFGEAPSTSFPVGGNSPIFTSSPLDANALYWVKVTNPGPAAQNSTTVLALVVADLFASAPGYHFSVNTAYPGAFSVIVKDSLNELAAGVPITFTVPASGASGLFAGNTLSATVNSDANGVATSPAFTANSTAGTYNVVATFSTTSINLPAANNPVVSSPAGVTFLAGLTNRFAFTETGVTSPIYSVSGHLPTGVSFTSAGTLSGTPIAGSAGTYPLTITVGNGTALTGTQNFTLTVIERSSVVAPVTFNNNGLGWALNGDTVNGGPSISGNTFFPTDGTGGENRSAWFRYPVYVGGFKASFFYMDIGGGGADGVAFVVQNSAAGTSALGLAGGSLGYSGISNSVAVLMNLYSGAPGGPSGVLLGTDGIGAGSGISYHSTAPVNLDSGDPIQVNLIYVDGLLNVILTDLINNASSITQYTVDIPAFVGTNEAYVGITGSEGGVFSRQLVSAFSFQSLPDVTTIASSGVANSSATLNGIVNPNGLATGVSILWGITPSFGNTIVLASLPAGLSPQNVSTTLTGLAPVTTYYYTVVVTNSSGTYSGRVLNFTTPALAPTVTTVTASSVTASSATLNGLVNPNGAETSVAILWGTTPSFGNTNVLSDLPVADAPQALSTTLTGLSPGIEYYFTVVATNTVGSGEGAVLNFTTTSVLPAVTTQPATGLASTSATLNASINPNGAATQVYFIWGPGTASGNTNLAANLPAGNTAVNVSETLTGLAPHTAYAYRVMAVNTSSTNLGSQVAFVTTGSPETENVAASSVTSNSVVLGGLVTARGASCGAWFSWGTTTNYGHTTAVTNIGAGWPYIPVTNQLAGLAPGTLYHFRLSATNNVGTTNSADFTFTTLAPPVAVTHAATNFTSTSATLNSSVTPNGLATAVYFIWGPGTNFGNTNLVTTLAANARSNYVSKTLTGLAPHTLYYFKAMAANSLGTNVGSSISFNTTGSPETQGVAVSSVTSTSAVLGGLVTARGASCGAWFAWGTNTSYGHTTAVTNIGSGWPYIPVTNQLTGLSPATTYHFRLSATNSAGTTNSADVTFTTPGAPTATTHSATVVTSTSGVLNGTVNPSGLATTVYFIWGPGTNGGNTNLAVNLPAGFAAINVSNAVTGLAPHSAYGFQVMAVNASGTNFGAQLMFNTSGTPEAQSVVVSSLTSTSAVLNASVLARGASCGAWFAWGTTTNYGQTTAVTNIGSGWAYVAISNKLAGLTPGTAYHFRLFATNSVGNTNSADLTFTTSAAGHLANRDALKPSVTSVQILSIIGLADGTKQIEIAATPGQSYVIEAVGDFADGEWKAIGSATADENGALVFVDPQSANAPSRFYRLQNQ